MMIVSEARAAVLKKSSNRVSKLISCTLRIGEKSQCTRNGALMPDLLPAVAIRRAIGWSITQIHFIKVTWHLLENQIPLNAQNACRCWEKNGLSAAATDVYASEYRKICAGAKIILGWNIDPTIDLYFSNRTWYTLG